MYNTKGITGLGMLDPKVWQIKGNTHVNDKTAREKADRIEYTPLQIYDDQMYTEIESKCSHSGAETEIKCADIFYVYIYMW